METTPRTSYVMFVKPLLDKVIALIVILASLPLSVIVILVLSLLNRGKIWFKQQRPGKHGKIFTIYKFKTMTDKFDDKGNLLHDKERLTRMGRIIRATSIDEIPQLINVIRGEMSIVGPRPLLVEYLPLYNSRQNLRHMVLPGITGWAQVNGRNSISWSDRLELDAWYVENIAFGLDVKILVLTFLKVLKSEGISSNTSVTMEKFNGND